MLTLIEGQQADDHDVIMMAMFPESRPFDKKQPIALLIKGSQELTHPLCLRLVYCSTVLE